MKIKSILKICYGKDYKHLHNGKYPVLGTGGVIDFVDDYLYSGESILIGRKGTINNPYYINGSFWTVDTLFFTKILSGFPKFIYYLLTTINWLRYNEASGVPSLSANNIKNINIKIPLILEQEKIANFLSLVDKKIELMEKKYGSLKLYKKGLVQQIFSQEIRFKNSENMFSDWENRKLSDFLFEHRLKSTDNEEVYSVSVHKGLINQIEHLGRNFSSKDTSKYNLVKPGDIVYTKSPTGEFPLGIIKQSQINKNVIVSPLYGVFFS